MINLSLEKINSFRKQGLRPDVVGCFVSNRQILLLYKKEHDLWQLPQGGIENKETPEIALASEMAEELGQDFLRSAREEIYFIGEDKVEFPKKTQDVRELFTDEGEQKKMIGKKYFFLAIPTENQKLDLSKTEFDDYRWLGYSEAMTLASKIYQSGKRRVTEKAIQLLKQNDLIE